MATLDNVNVELIQRIEWVMEEADKVGHEFWVTTGHRDADEQKRLWKDWQEGIKQYGSETAAMAHGVARAARPGYSLHERNPALAVDLACWSEANTLRAHLADKAGLCTPINGEPWHMQLHPDRKPLPTSPTSTPPTEDDEMKPDLVVDILPADNGGTYALQRDGGVLARGPEGQTAEGAPPFYGSYPGLPEKDRQGERYFVRIVARKDGQPGYVLLAGDGSHYVFPTS